MAALAYREDMDAVRDRLTRWWRGEDIGRPALLITTLRETPIRKIPPHPPPEGWLTNYSTRDFDYRVHLAARFCEERCFFGEAVPHVAPDLAPNCLALYLGCAGIEMSDSVWCAPCIETPDSARFEVDPDNFYWQFTLRLGDAMRRLGQGHFLVAFPDLIEGLDTLEAMRGGMALLDDLYIRPEWVHDCLVRITELYFFYYDALYQRFRDETGGSHYWMWAPGRMAKLQCDFSAMIGPDMFAEFMLPVLKKMTERLDFSMYHWDGPGALLHHDHLLSIPRLNAIQWTPGEGQPPPPHRHWWPIYHKTVDAGKAVILNHGATPDDLAPLQREFGPKLKRFAISLHLNHPEDAEAITRRLSD